VTDETLVGTYVLRDEAAEEAVAAIPPSARPRLRMLVVRCANAHKLAEIVRTGLGPVLIARAPSNWVRAHQDTDGGTRDVGRWQHRRDVWCIRFDYPDDQMLWKNPVVFDQFGKAHSLGGYPEVFICHCRCREPSLPHAWLLEQIKAGRPRVVWRD
jgi:hypothetical protein